MLFIRSFLRNLVRYKTFSIINITGLSFSLAFILLIGSYLVQEFSYDRGYSNIDQLYMVVDSSSSSGDADYRIKQMLLDNVPELESGGIYYTGDMHLNHLDKVFTGNKVASVDNDFFRLFQVSFIKGNAKKPFHGFDEAIISESKAAQMFGTDDPIGKSVILNHKIPLTIVGVVNNFPATSTIQGEFFVNAENPVMHFSMRCENLHEGENPEDKCCMNFTVFVQLQKGTDPELIEKKYHSFAPKDDNRYPHSIILYPLKNYHLSAKYNTWGLEQGNPSLLKILSWIVLAIVFLAVINYVNLTTAGYHLRMKETGVKKTLGAKRNRIVGQYLSESIILCFLSAYLSVFIAHLLLPWFNNFLHTQLTITVFSDPRTFMLFLGFNLFIGIIAGLYPAIYLSGISPKEVLSSNIFVSRSGKTIRSLLNVFQFTIAIILIVAMLIMQKQIRYVKHQNLGFNTERLLRLSFEMQQNKNSYQIVMDKLRQLPEVLSISATSSVPGEIRQWMNNHAVIGIDTNFYKTFGIHVIDGRELLPGDIDKCCLINETSLKKNQSGDYHGKEVNGCKIVGVVSDFHITSLHTGIEPTALMSYTWMIPDNLSLRISGNNVPRLMDEIRKIWKEVCPDYPFHFNFYDEWFDSMYKKEEDLGKLVSLFALLAIAISCMGIFGLALFSAERRTKEIGIRKVNGAAIPQVIYILSKEYFRLVVAGFIIACPVSWYALDRWLNGFAYHTRITWWVYLVAGMLALIVAVFTVSGITWRSARRNPVDALRYE